MKYLGIILGSCLIVFAAFAIFKYTPDAFSGVRFLATGIYNVVSSISSR